MIKELINEPAGSVKIDWCKVEKHLGFKMHNNVKNFYSRIVCDEKIEFRGRMKFIRDKFIIPTGNQRYDKFLFDNGNTNDWDAQGNDTYYYLALLSSTDLKDLPKKFEQLFNMAIWRHIENMENRLYIGCLIHRIGEVCMFINNNSGVFEWAYLQDKRDNYYDNPNGIIAYDADEFISKLNNKLE